jgi:HD-like signal output (HDOD) protein
MNDPLSEVSIVQAVNNLPPMPKVASRVLALADDPNCGNELVELLSRDGALAASVLRMANSVVFARRHKIGNLEEAVLTIGLNALKGMVLATTLDTLLGADGPIKELIWEKSVGTAISAATLARQLEWQLVDEAFLLGLLHNLGQVVLSSSEHTADRYGQVIERIRKDSVDYATAEQAVFGVSYPGVGALLAKRWSFPEEICEVIAKHQAIHEPVRAVVDERRILVRLAELICHACGLGKPDNYPAQSAQLQEVALQIKSRAFSAARDVVPLQKAVARLFAEEGRLYRAEKGGA